MIEVKDVQRYYIVKQSRIKKEKFYALKDVSAIFRDGDIFAIFGDSGSGKTTLGDIISGYQRPDTGSVFYNGSLERKNKSVRYVFQDPYTSLNPAKDVRWHIETTSSLNNLDLVNVWNTFELTGLSRRNYETRLISTLSGGERQMLAFSIALSQQPDCMVLDEPFSYLDTLTLFRLLSILRKTKDKVLYIYMDNDMNRCAYVSDMIYILKRGKIIEQGTPEKIINSPENEFTREVIEKMPDLHKRI
ncbi:MAG: ATP-binding cassette domain-containing protein [Thermoplasmatales archaeon]|nr:ATP-binding cassette domain-containing protein [Thermoplasmatales archaeon]MCW6169605.1 ATP-binding cassette domain-containing protein [Thermoplasmatales archaeon]